MYADDYEYIDCYQKSKRVVQYGSYSALYGSGMGGKEDDDIKFTFTFYGLSCSQFRMVLLLGAIDEQSKEETFEGESVTQITHGGRVFMFPPQQQEQMSKFLIKLEMDHKGL